MNAVSPHFADPVHQSQEAFRVLLKALSRPGRRLEIPVPATPPPPLQGPAAAAALTLLDFSSPLWLDAASTTPEALRYIHYHTGAPLVAEPAKAAFAIIADVAQMPPLTAFAAGEAAYPDRSTTLILQIASLTQGPAVTLEGPGTETSISVAPAGLPAWFWSAWTANSARYPLGIDLFLVDAQSIMGLPRTTKVLL